MILSRRSSVVEHVYLGCRVKFRSGLAKALCGSLALAFSSANALAQPAAGGAAYQPSGFASRIFGRLRYSEYEGFPSVVYGGNRYKYLIPVGMSDGLTKATGAGVDRFLVANSRVGTPISIMCAINFGGVAMDVSSFGMNSIRGYHSFNCIDSRGGNYYIYLPLHEEDKINAALAGMHGEAAKPGFFGRKGQVLFLGRLSPKNPIGFSGKMAGAVSIVVEYWSPTSKTIDYDRVYKDVMAGATVSAEVIKAIKNVMPVE